MSSDVEEVGVYVPGLRRPLYGTVQTRQGGQVTVRVVSERGEATITVPADWCRPWRGARQ